MINVRLRKRYLEGNFDIAVVGSPVDLTFEVNHLGTSLSTLAQIAEGKHPFSRTLAQAEKPVIIIGGDLLNSDEAEVASNLLAYIKKGLPNLNTSSWNGINVLPTGANQVGHMDLGLNYSASTNSKVLYLFGCRLLRG